MLKDRNKCRIHYHSQASYFSGAENMLVNFFLSPEIRKEYEISFSYCHSVEYEYGLNNRLQQNISRHPFRFPEPSNLIPFPENSSQTFKRLISFISRLIFTLPIVAYELFRLHRLFIIYQPDILHINNAGYPAALSSRVAAVSARLAGVPFVIMVVNNMAVKYDRPSRWLNYPFDRFVVKSISKFVTGSSVAAEQLKKVLRLDDSKCMVINNGIKLRYTTETITETKIRLGLSEFDGINFGVVSILRPNKGHKILLEAMAQISRLYPEYLTMMKILIEGDGPSRDELEVMVTTKQLSDHCIFVGCENNVMNFMSFIDVLILPSVSYEDFPNVILEAMGLGKPVIASRLAGTSEQVVDGISGFLVAPGNVDQLASAIIKILKNKQLLLRMGIEAKNRFQTFFTAEIAVNKYHELYRSSWTNTPTQKIHETLIS
jgi:glycosyltransferase involved in cell wall biosynthesis